MDRPRGRFDVSPVVSMSFFHRSVNTGLLDASAERDVAWLEREVAGDVALRPPCQADNCFFCRRLKK